MPILDKRSFRICYCDCFCALICILIANVVWRSKVIFVRFFLWQWWWPFRGQKIGVTLITRSPITFDEKTRQRSQMHWTKQPKKFAVFVCSPQFTVKVCTVKFNSEKFKIRSQILKMWFLTYRFEIIFQNINNRLTNNSRRLLIIIYIIYGSQTRKHCVALCSTFNIILSEKMSSEIDSFQKFELIINAHHFQMKVGKWNAL